MDAANKLLAITEGFKNYLFPMPIIEELATERAKICADCDKADPEHPFKKLLDDNRTEEIKGMGCSVCNCLLSAKVRQLREKCPLDKWE